MGISASRAVDGRGRRRSRRCFVSAPSVCLAPTSHRHDGRCSHARRASPVVTMTPLDRAVHDIAEVLESLHIAYAIIGGIANAIWGEPRATIDVDVTVSVKETHLGATIAAIVSRLTPAVADPVAFVQETRVLPLDTVDGVRIDVIFALLPFELEAIERSKEVSIAGRMVHVVTAEDLILMKIISDRPRDLTDAE